MSRFSVSFLAAACVALLPLPVFAANGALQFDGAQSVAIPHGPALDFDEQVTVEGWIKCADLAGYNPLLRKNIDFLQDNYDLRLDGPCRLEFICKVNEQAIRFGAPHCFETNRWYHIAGTFDGQYLRAFVDGELIGEQFQPGRLSRDPVVTYIGHGDGDYFRGQIDSVRLWSVARSAQELGDSRFGGLDPAHPGLVGYWTFDEEEGQVIRNLKGIGLDGTLGETASPGPDDPQRVPSDVPVAPPPPPVPFEAILVPGGSREVTLVLAAGQAFKGGEVGLTYDPVRLVPDRIEPGAGFPEEGRLFFQTSPQNNCSGEMGASAGLTVAWLNSTTRSVSLPPGRYEVVSISFKLAAGAEPGSCSPLRFVQCLGVPGALVRNIVTSSSGASVPLLAHDEEVCVTPESPFRRGDANHDGFQDVSDAISIGDCLFLGDQCRGCPDALDSNDDGDLDITDLIYLLAWRFLGGPEPPPPLGRCGEDGSRDALEPCQEFSGCHSLP
jgi:hypothetical protein